MERKNNISYVNMYGILKACRKNIPFILAAVLICVVAIYGYYSLTHIIQREYVVEFNYTVLPDNMNTQNGRLSNSDMDASASLGALYSNLYCDSTYTDRILSRIGINSGSNGSNAAISSSITDSPHVYKMRISSDSAPITQMVVDAVVEDLQTSEGLPPGSKVVFNEDIYHIDVMESSRSSLVKYIAVGILLGLFVSISIITLKSIAQCVITEPSMPTALSGLPVLAQASAPIKKVER